MQVDLGVSYIGNTDSIVFLGTGALNSAIGVGWLGISSTNSTDSVVLLGVSISIGKIVWFCIAITSLYISKQLFYAIGKRS